MHISCYNRVTEDILYGIRVRIFQSIGKSKVPANHTTGEPHETVTLTTLYAHRHVFEDIFWEAHQLEISAHEGKTVMYTSRGMEWGTVRRCETETPVAFGDFGCGIKERIVDDVKDFLGRQKWYVDRGIPYRRGYLLYGPPGSGKSSFIQALAGELDFGVAIINLSERGTTDDKLAHLLTKMPPRTVLLLEMQTQLLRIGDKLTRMDMQELQSPSPDS